VFFICHTPMRANSIVLRIEAVLTMLRKLFGSLEAVSKDRFIIAGENFYYLFHQDNGIVNFKMLATIKQVLAELGRSQDTYSNVYFDPGVLDATPIPSIYAYNRPGIIQLFYYVHKAAVKLYVLDERGSLLMCQHDKADPAYLLYQYAQFLESIIMRAMHDDLTIDYYEIIKDAEGMFSCLPIDVKTPAHTGSLVVRITGETLKTGISYTIYCNEKEFSTLDYGDDLFSQVQRYIHQFRTKKSDYPIYISDLDLPLSAFNINSYEQLQTVHYLSYKQKIEAKFNS
jgi:adenylate cyclase class 1